MAVSVVAHYPDLDAETYDKIVASLELDANPPVGAILHVAGETDGSITTSEIWQTEQTFRAFLDYRLRPALRLHGVHREPLVEVGPLDRAHGLGLAARTRRGHPVLARPLGKNRLPSVCAPTGGRDTLVRVIAVARTRRPEERAQDGR